MESRLPVLLDFDYFDAGTLTAGLESAFSLLLCLTSAFLVAAGLAGADVGAGAV